MDRIGDLRNLALGLALALGFAAPAGGQEFRVQVDEPVRQTTETRVPLLEVKGQAGLRRTRGSDLVIVLDLSESTLHETGLDLDGDGADGATSPDLLAWLEAQPGAPGSLPRLLGEERDFEDTVLAAELEAAAALIERLPFSRFRVGLVVFSDEARVVAPVGTPRPNLQRALRELSRDFHRELRGSNFAAAVETAHSALVPDPEAPPSQRELAMILLSDGAPTLPVHGDRAERSAVAAAGQAGLDGIRLHAFALGPGGADAMRVLSEMAEQTGGAAQHVEQPGEAVTRLRDLDLASLASVTIENLTTGATARAPRTFPDGSFDGILRLAPGSNRVRVSARSRAGSSDQVERVVKLLTGADPSDVARTRDLLEELRSRTREMELWAQVEKRRREQQKVVEIRGLAPATAQ